MWTLYAGLLCAALWVCQLAGGATAETRQLSENNNTLYLRDLIRYSKGAELSSYVDATQKPCANFYKHVCGNWAKVNPSRQHNGAPTVTWDLLEDAYERKIRHVLNRVGNATYNAVDQAVLGFYESCTTMRHQLSERHKAKLRTVISEFGEMPAIVGMAAWKAEQFDWVQTVAEISLKYGLNVVLGLSIRRDIAVNSNANRVFLHRPKFPNIGANFGKRRIRKVLAQVLDANAASIAHLADELFRFEQSLAGDTRSKIEPKVYGAEQLQQKYAHVVDIKKYLDVTLGEEAFTEGIYDISESYMQKLAIVLPRTPKKLLANYIFYKLIADFYIKNEHSEEAQQKMCAEKTREYFARNVDSMIFRIYNGERTRKDLQLMLHEMKSELQLKLASPTLDWLKERTRKQALAKLTAISLELSTYDDDEFNKQIEQIDMNRMDFIGNIQHIKVERHRANFDKWHQPFRLADAAAEDNLKLPKFYPRENIIRVPVSFVQPHILWDAQYPYALKFATLGSIIGNRLMHGFDDGGRKYDQDGRSQDWWDETTLQNYYNRAECFHKQLEKYASTKSDEETAQSSSPQTELVADSVGVALAYAAYQQWFERIVRDNDSFLMEMERLPNLKYTNQQLFFISFAHMWCEDHRAHTHGSLAGDYAQSGEFRVNAPLSNLLEFSQAFECAKESAMNPIEKCEIY